MAGSFPAISLFKLSSANFIAHCIISRKRSNAHAARSHLISDFSLYPSADYCYYTTMAQNKFYVYMAWHAITDVPIYVGKGCDGRIDSHNKLVNEEGYHYNNRIFNYIKKYGKLDCIVIRDCLTNEEALDTERSLILYFGREDKGDGTLFNRTDGGEGTSGPKSEDWKRKISVALKGRKRSPEHCAALSKAKKGKPMPRMRALASKTFKGVPKTKEHNAKNSEAQKGKPKSSEHRMKLSLAAKRRYAREKGDVL